MNIADTEFEFRIAAENNLSVIWIGTENSSDQQFQFKMNVNEKESVNGFMCQQSTQKFRTVTLFRL